MALQKNYDQILIFNDYYFLLTYFLDSYLQSSIYKLKIIQQL